jgi:DNA-binding transcriptional LysR family regulator
VDRQADGPCRLDDDHSRARQLGAGFSPVIRHEARLWQTVVTMVGFGMGVALAPKTMRRAGDAEPMTARFMEVLHEAVRESAPT